MTAQLRPAAADSPQLKQRQRQRGKEADTHTQKKRQTERKQEQRRTKTGGYGGRESDKKMRREKFLDEDGAKERERGREIKRETELIQKKKKNSLVF